MWTASVESPQPIIYPYDNVIGMQKIGPDQVDVAVIVYIFGQKRAKRAEAGAESENRDCFEVAEMDLDGFLLAGLSY